MRHTLLITLSALIFSGCKSTETTPEEDFLTRYERPLPAGAPAFTKVPTDQWPDIGSGFRRNPTDLVKAGKRSLSWFDKKSTTSHFPVEGVSHAHAKASVEAMLSLLRTSRSGAAFTRALKRDFDCFMSIGCDDEGTVLFTGYCSLELEARRRPNAKFKYPVYARPDALQTNPITGQVLGWSNDGKELVPPPDRSALERGLLDGTELFYFDSPLEAYLVHVNGSAKLRLGDGSVTYLGFGGTNGREYSSLGRVLKARGVVSGPVTIEAIRNAYLRNPAAVTAAMQQNERFVFFRETSADGWPSGSLGFQVEAQRSLATDKSIFPRGGFVYVDTTMNRQPFAQWMLDQDTGGAIRAPGRADLYLGAGDRATAMAGEQAEEGQLYYFFLKDAPR
ncbi:MAG: hypothetical protein CMJ28_07550 [Phycisphaerae bacterium]|nr:hypothetical protein [Phycisphaerae bacterium]